MNILFKNLLYAIFFLFCLTGSAQKLTPYAPLREADVMWSKRMWRIIDLREKLNLPLYYPLQPYDNYKSLFDVIRDGILTRNIQAYGNPAFDDSFTDTLSLAEVQSILINWDSTHTGINVLGEEEIQPLKTEVTSENVKQYLIKEDWFFDKQRSCLNSRIIGICPMIESFTESGEFKGYKPLFWIYFPQLREVLAKYSVFNRQNAGASLNFDDVFIKRMFTSIIIKESNIYDRYIAEYKQGIDALIESNAIEEKMFTWEDGLWHY